jgi:hypothetical protein
VFRATQYDPEVRRWIRVRRDGEPVTVLTHSAVVLAPSGVQAAVATILEDSADALIRLEFSAFDEFGQHQVEVLVNGEHLEEPIPLYVRPLWERGPR